MLPLDPETTVHGTLEDPGPKVVMIGFGLGTGPAARSVSVPEIAIAGSAPSCIPLPFESTQTAQTPLMSLIWQLTLVFWRIASNFANFSIPANCEAVELS